MVSKLLTTFTIPCFPKQDKFPWVGWSLVWLLLVGTIFLDNVRSVSSQNQDENNDVATAAGAAESARIIKTFDVWTKFKRGYTSVTVQVGENLPIRCRVSLNGTELIDDNDLERVNMTWSKDGMELPDYWSDQKLAEEDEVTVHSKASFVYVTATEGHRGWFKCQGSYEGVTKVAEFYVRVKEDKSIWPGSILGLEVVLLCIIYFSYERWLKGREPQLDD